MSTLFLPDSNFYKKYSNHFTHNGEPFGPTDMRTLRTRKAERRAQRQALAEAEEMLVKCHALCDPTGLAAADSDGAPSEVPTG